MPTQRFSPMTKDFPTFDCDAHVVEPALVWEMAADSLPKDELEALKATMWYDAPNNQVIVNGKTDVSNFYPIPDVGTGKVDIVRLAGPGMKHNIQRAINVRNVNPETAITEEQSRYLAHDGAGEPGPRLRDMDTQGIDQVMLIPSDIDTYPWLQDALGAKAMCKAYNDWAYNYTLEDPERLFFAALLPMQSPTYAVEELYRVAQMGCRVALIRPMDAQGNYPVQPKYEPLWNALEDTGVVYGMHPFPAFGNAKPPGYTEQYSGAELIRRTMTTSGLPHRFLANVQNFQAEAALWVTLVLMSGFFERHPKINAAVFEASSTWLSFLLDECDKTYTLYRNERKLPALKRLPSETFFQHCVTGFRGRRGPAVAHARVLQGHPRLVLRRVSPRRRRRLGGHRDDGRVRASHRLPSQVPRRQRPTPLQHRPTQEHHPSPRHRDRAPRLVAHRTRNRRLPPPRIQRPPSQMTGLAPLTGTISVCPWMRLTVRLF